MSQLENSKEQLKNISNNLRLKIQESAMYAQATDRYESLTPLGQKLVLVAGVFVFLLVLLFYPLSNISTSQYTISLFEEKRSLIRELFRTYRESSAAPSIAMPPNADGLRSALDAIVKRAELQAEQNLGITDGAIEGRLIPKNLVSYVLELRLAKLNLKQIVDIGASIVGVSESVKMKDLVIVANPQDTRYFDVTYKLYSLKVPEPTPEPPPEPEIKGKKPSSDSKGANE